MTPGRRIVASGQGNSDAAPGQSPEWIRRLEMTAILSLPAAYVAGYLASTFAVRGTGLYFIEPSAIRLASLGAMSLLLSMAVFGSAVLCRQLEEYSRKNRARAPFLVGLGASIALGTMVPYATTSILLSWFGRDTDLYTAIPAGVLGGVLVPGIYLLTRYVMATGPNIIARPSLLGNKASLPFLALTSLLLSSPLVGLAVAPHVPAALGGIAPEIAMVQLDPAHQGIPEYLANHAGNDVEGESIFAPMWVFAIADGSYHVRHGCDDVRNGAAYALPHDAVLSVQWVLKTTFEDACTG